MKVEPQEFLTWLESHGDAEVVGLRDDVGNGPVANWLSEKDALRWEVYDDVLSSSDGSSEIEIDTPKWIVDFNARVDAPKNDGPITASEAAFVVREIIKSIIPENRFLEFVAKIASDGDWEYEDGSPMSADAAAHLKSVQWHDCRKVRPPHMEYVLTWNGHFVRSMRLEFDLSADCTKWSWGNESDFSFDGVTHWMALPAAPQEEGTS